MGLTPVDLAVIGGMSGTFEVCLMQPTVAFKNAIQEGRPLPWNPVHMYRGLGMNILSVAPITAAQFGTNFFYKSLHRQLTGSETMSSRDRVATSFAAGATSAALANPTELVVIRQQQTGLPLSTACYNLFRTHGHRTISVAIVPTMLREGIYASFWMEGMPLIAKALDSTQFVSENLPAGSSTLVAGVTAGVIGSTLSHPFDTIKVRMQAFIDKDHPQHSRYDTVSKTIRHTIQDEGAGALLKGVGPRAFRITCAVFILTFCRNELSPYYLQGKNALFGITEEAS